eukprot:2290017-Rhodomonas_salina.3
MTISGWHRVSPVITLIGEILAYRYCCASRAARFVTLAMHTFLVWAAPAPTLPGRGCRTAAFRGCAHGHNQCVSRMSLSEGSLSGRSCSSRHVLIGFSNARSQSPRG